MKTIYLQLGYVLKESIKFNNEEKLSDIELVVTIKNERKELTLNKPLNYRFVTFKYKTLFIGYFSIEVEDNVNVYKEISFNVKTKTLKYKNYDFSFKSILPIDKTAKTDIWTSDENGNLIELDWTDFK